MSKATDHLVCTGTLVEHAVGPVECTADECAAAAEEHWLVVTCAEFECRCGGAMRSPSGGADRAH